MEYCLLQQRHAGAALALWQQVFGDETSFIEQCFGQFVRGGFLMTALDGNAVAAILLAAPCMFEARKGVYLYALATSPEQRGAGVMTGLMLAAEREAAMRGGRFAVLVPAGASLFSYYEKRGYGEHLCLRHVELPPLTVPALPLPHGARHLPKLRQLEGLRKKFLNTKPVVFSPPQSSMIEEDMAKAGLAMETSDVGYAVVLKQGNRLLVAELGAPDDGTALELVGKAARRIGCESAIITLPECSPLFSGMGESRPFALAKPLHDAFSMAGAYLRFALDVVEDSFVPLDKME